MLAQIRKTRVRTRGITKLVLLFIVAAGIASCATKEPPPLVSDPTAKKESSIPWNEQERWENEGQLGQMAERYEQGGNHR